jgi:hypothetical protein
VNTDKSEVLQGTLDLMILNSLHALGSLYGFRITLRIEQVSEDVLTWIFNVGMLLSGIAAIVGSYGLFRAFRRRAGLVWSLLVGIGVLGHRGHYLQERALPPAPSATHFLGISQCIHHRHPTAPAHRRMASPFACLASLLPDIFCRPRASAFSIHEWLISVSHPGKGTFQCLFAIANFIPVGITAYALRTRQ